MLNKTRWIQTYTGRKVYPLELTPDQVCVEDVAHALALKCRFTGHCREFYSVADHSLRVAAQLQPGQQVHGLLHDAAEAYLPDAAGPIKPMFRLAPGIAWRPQLFDGAAVAAEKRDGSTYHPTFDEVENHVLRVVYEGLGVPFAWSKAVRMADETLLATEARDLMGEPPSPWHLDVPVLPDRIAPRSPAQAEADFLARFHELTGGGR